MKVQQINLNGLIASNQLKIYPQTQPGSFSPDIPQMILPIAQQLFFILSSIQNKQKQDHQPSNNIQQQSQQDTQDYDGLCKKQNPILLPIQTSLNRLVKVEKQKLHHILIETSKNGVFQELRKDFYQSNFCFFMLGLIFLILRIVILAIYLQELNKAAITIFSISGVLLIFYVFPGLDAVKQNKEKQLLQCQFFGLLWFSSEIGASVCVFAYFRLYEMRIGFLIMFVLFLVILAVVYIVIVRLAWKIRPLIIDLFGMEINDHQDWN